MSEDALSTIRDRIIATDRLIREGLENSREIEILRQSLEHANQRILMLEAENARMALEKGIMQA